MGTYVRCRPAAPDPGGVSKAAPACGAARNEGATVTSAADRPDPSGNDPSRPHDHVGAEAVATDRVEDAPRASRQRSPHRGARRWRYTTAVQAARAITALSSQ
jgi:hypothetical protein